MPAWAIPLIVQGAEAIGTGIAAAMAAHAVAGCGWWDCALVAAIAAAAGKLLPKQILSKK